MRKGTHGFIDNWEHPNNNKALTLAYEARSLWEKGSRVECHRLLKRAYLLIGNLVMAYNEVREAIIEGAPRDPMTNKFLPKMQAKYDFCCKRQNFYLQ